MVLAFAAILLVAGPGLVLAGPDPTYVPKISTLLGPNTVAPKGSAQFTLRVTFTNGRTADFPPETGAKFSAISGTITSSGAYKNTGSTGGKDKVTASFSQQGVTVTSTRIFYIK